jgi:hypothetical protein
LRTPRAAFEIVQKVDRAKVGLTVDAAHFFGGGGLMGELDQPEELRQQAGVEVRLIFRVIPSDEDKAREHKERMVALGISRDSIKVQENCHTKGIVVDSKAVLVGSQNWTNQGVLANRDASLIFFHEGIAKYFEEAFLFDWDTLTRQPRTGRPGGGGNERLVLAVEGVAAPPRSAPISVRELLAD